MVVDAEPAWHRAADLAVALGVDVWDTSDAEGKMCFIFPIRGAGGSPSTRRQHAAAAHSKEWHGLAQPGHAAQDG